MKFISIPNRDLQHFYIAVNHIVFVCKIVQPTAESNTIIKLSDGTEIQTRLYYDIVVSLIEDANKK